MGGFYLTGGVPEGIEITDPRVDDLETRVELLESNPPDGDPVSWIPGGPAGGHLAGFYPNPTVPQLAVLDSRLDIIEGSGGAVTGADIAALDARIDILEAGGVGGSGEVTQVEFDALEVRVDDLEAGVGPTDPSEGITLGDATPGVRNGGWPSSGSHSFMRAAVAPYRALATKIRVSLTGDGPGGAGTQPARAVVYSKSGVPDLATGVLLGAGNPITLVNPTATAVYEFTLPDTTIIEEGNFSFGIHFSLSGSVNQAMTIDYNTDVANSTLTNDDLYENGTQSPFGALTAGYSWLMQMEIDIEPAPDDLSSDIVALDVRLDTAEADIDTLQAQVAEIGDGSSSAVTAAEIIGMGATLAASDQWYTEPKQLTAGAGALAMATEYAISGGSGTLRAQDYVAGAWRNGQAQSVVSTVLTNTELVTANQAVRMAVTASASAEVELSVGVVT